MWNRIKSLFGGGDGGGTPAFTREDLDQLLNDAMEGLHSGAEPAEVTRLLEQPLSTLRAGGEPSVLAHAYFNTAMINMAVGDSERAVELLTAASEVPATDHAARKDRLTYLMNLGDVLTHAGQLDEAEPHLRQGLAEREEFYGADHPGVAFGLTSLAANLLRQGRASEALPLIDRAVEINGSAGQPEVVEDLALRAFVIKGANGPNAEAFGLWAELAHDQQSAVLSAVLRHAEESQTEDEARLAVSVLGELADQLTDAFSLSDHLNVNVATCNAARLAKDHEARIAAGHRALDVAKQMNDPSVLVNVHEGIAFALGDAGRPDGAEQSYKEAIQVAEQAQDKALVAGPLRNLGLFYSELERYPEAEENLERATVECERADPQMHGRCLVAYGIFLQHRERLDEASDALERSIALLPVADADRFCAMSHFLALQQGRPCGCDDETGTQAAGAIVEEIVRRSAPEGLLESLSLNGPQGVEVHLAREPKPEEIEQLDRLIHLAMAQLQQGARTSGYR